MRPRLHAGFLLALASLALAAPAAAHWQAQPLVTPGWQPLNVPSGALTSEGDSIVHWTEGQGSTYRTLLGVFPLSGDPVTIELGSYATSVQIATDGAGGAVALWSSSNDNDIHWRERPSGGTFGPEQTLGLTPSQPLNPVAAMNARGDLAFVWARFGEIYAALRPAGQATFGAPQDLGQVAHGYPAGVVPRLSDSGELVVALQTYETTPTEVQAVHRSAAGEVSGVQTISSLATSAEIRDLAMDAAGHAILTWQQDAGAAGGGQQHMSVRDPGGDFTAARFPGAGPHDYRQAVGLTGDGLVTIAYEVNSALRVYGGPFGGPFRLLHTYSPADGNGVAAVRIATSRSGRTLLGWTPAYPHWASAQRTGDGDLGPAEDVDPSCAGMSWPTMGIDDSGNTLAVWGGYYESPAFVLARGDAGPGQQTCMSPGAYNAPDSANPPPEGGPGGGSWIPPAAPPPGHILPALALKQPTLGGSGADRNLLVRGSCGEFCYAYGSLAVVGPKGRVLYRVKLTGAQSDGTGRLRFQEPFKLSAALRRKIARRPLTAELRLRVGDTWSRRISRHYTLRGRTVKP